MPGSIKFLRSSSGARIAFTTAGSGPPVVLVPPWVSHLEGIESLSGYRPFVEAITRHHTLVQYDRWGTGLSDRDRTDFSMERDVEVLLDVADHLRLRRFVVVGPSHGGPVAIDFALHHPKRVSHLVLCATRPHALVRREVWASFRELFLADWNMAARAGAAVALQGAALSDIEAFVDLLNMSGSPQTAVALQDVAMEHDMTSLLGQLSVPTLVVQRRGDPIVTSEEGRILASQIPGARLELLDGDAHVMWVGDSAAIAEKVRGFAAGAAGAPSAQLSAREAEILDLVAKGSSNAEAAVRLDLSVRTVERHLLNAYRKLGVRGRAEAAARWAGQLRSPT